MPEYNYTVRDKKGTMMSGKIEAPSLQAVHEGLSKSGLIVVSIKPVSVMQKDFEIPFLSGRVKLKELAVFARQFSTMVNAGLSLTKCLSILAEQSENPTLRKAITQVAKDVEAGQSLSDALALHQKVFPKLMISMVRAGETGGVLDEVLRRVAESFEKDVALRGKIKSAMTYPVAMGGLILVILVAMLVFVVPTFQKMFADMGGTLPLPTQILINVSHFMVSAGGFVMYIAIGVGIFAFLKFKKTPQGAYLWDSFKLRMPVFGPLVKKIALARFTRTLGTLVAAGVPILAAMDIVADTSGNEVIARVTKASKQNIKEGLPISQPLAESKIFPSMMVQMIAIGEESGSLDMMLEKVASFYDEEASTSVESLTSLIEPLMMAFMGVTVGGMVLALYMPMFQVITLVK